MDKETKERVLKAAEETPHKVLSILPERYAVAFMDKDGYVYEINRLVLDQDPDFAEALKEFLKRPEVEDETNSK